MRMKPAESESLCARPGPHLDRRYGAQALFRLLRMPEKVAAAATDPHPAGGPADKPRILLVDDAPAIALLARILRHACEPLAVPDAGRLVDCARRPDARPDLILLDATTPAGMEACRRLKSDEATWAIPIVAITDGRYPSDEARALELGADDCVTRPFRAEVVEARIRAQLRVKRRIDQLERHANQDALTEVANRRCFDLTLDAEWRRAMRSGQPLALVMIDVDCFKQYNDLYGHREGDHCLRRVARALSQALTRPGDFLARYGGEEFAAILPATDLEGARCIGERLRHAVAALDIPQQRPDGARKVSISVGCGCVRPSASLTCYTLLQSADEHLYVAKHAGRDCVR